MEIHRENETVNLINKSLAGAITISAMGSSATREDPEYIEPDKIISDVTFLEEDGNTFILTPQDTAISAYRWGHTVALVAENITYSACQRLLSSNQSFVSAYRDGATWDGVYAGANQSDLKAFCARVDTFKRQPMLPGDKMNDDANLILCYSSAPEGCVLTEDKPCEVDGETIAHGQSYEDCGVCHNGEIKPSDWEKPDCQVCDALTGWKIENEPDGNIGGCSMCEGGVLKADPSAYNIYCKTCNPSTGLTTPKEDGTEAGTCGKCLDGAVVEAPERYDAACQVCEATTGVLTPKANGTAVGTCKQCDGAGNIVAKEGYVVPTCQVCRDDGSLGNVINGTSCGTNMSCQNGSCQCNTGYVLKTGTTDVCVECNTNDDCTDSSKPVCGSDNNCYLSSINCWDYWITDKGEYRVTFTYYRASHKTCACGYQIDLPNGERPFVTGGTASTTRTLPVGTHVWGNCAGTGCGSSCQIQLLCPGDLRESGGSCVCPSGKVPKTGTTDTCVECNNDTDCAGRTDGKTKCDTSSGLCMCPEHSSTTVTSQQIGSTGCYCEEGYEVWNNKCLPICPVGSSWSDTDGACVTTITVSGNKYQEWNASSPYGRYNDYCQLYFTFPETITSGKWQIVNAGGGASISESTWWGPSNCQGSHTFTFGQNDVIDLDNLSVTPFPTTDINRDCYNCCDRRHGVHVHSSVAKNENRISTRLEVNTVTGYQNCSYTLNGVEGTLESPAQPITMTVKKID